MNHVALLLLVLSLSFGLVFTTLARVTAWARECKAGALLAHGLLIFNLLVSLSLVLRYFNQHIVGPVEDPSAHWVNIWLLNLCAVFKVSWLLLLIASANRLLHGTFPVIKTAFVLSLALMSLIAAGSRGDLERFYFFQWALDRAILGGLILGSLRLLWGFDEEFRAGPIARKTLALIHIVLPGLMIGSLSLDAGPLLSPVLMLLYSLSILLWVLHYTPQHVVASHEEDNHEEIYEKYGISNREREVIELIRQGKTNKEIAEALFISVATVKDHNHSIYRKTDVKNRVQLSNLFR